jgi:putative DNA primase/helicase
MLCVRLAAPSFPRCFPFAEGGVLDLRDIALALGGEVCGQQVLAPGPAHSRRDRSLSVRISDVDADGFVVFSHAGDDWRICRDYVREKLGIERRRVSFQPETKLRFKVSVQVGPKAQGDRPAQSPQLEEIDDDAKRIADAVGLFRESVDPRGTLAATYFASRRLEIADLASRVIRWNSRIGAMVALFRNIKTGEPQAVSRTFLDAEARKIERKFLGLVGGAAVMLDAFDTVSHGLHVGEGVETCQAGRQLGLRPTWALGSAGAIAGFPVLGGIQTLTILGEHDDANARAIQACGARWHDAGREVLVTKPFRGKDLNDVLKGDAA